MSGGCLQATRLSTADVGVFSGRECLQETRADQTMGICGFVIMSARVRISRFHDTRRMVLIDYSNSYTGVSTSPTVGKHNLILKS